MATVKRVSIVEQNSNTLNGVGVDTAVYIGTGATNLHLQVGRDAPVTIIEGTQTAQIVNIVAGGVNAYRGAALTVRLGTGASAGTSIFRFLNSSFAGAVVGQITSGVGREMTVVFDGERWYGG